MITQLPDGTALPELSAEIIKIYPSKPTQNGSRTGAVLGIAGDEVDTTFWDRDMSSLGIGAEIVIKSGTGAKRPPIIKGSYKGKPQITVASTATIEIKSYGDVQTSPKDAGGEDQRPQQKSYSRPPAMKAEEWIEKYFKVYYMVQGENMKIATESLRLPNTACKDIATTIMLSVGNGIIEMPETDKEQEGEPF